MENIFKLSFLILLGVSMLHFSSCKEESITEQYGYLKLDLDNNTETISHGKIKEVSVDTFNVEILNTDGHVVWQVESYKDIEGDIELLTGDYFIRAYSNNNVQAAFDNPYYYGESEIFSIKKGDILEVSLTCYLANVKVTVSYSEQVIADFTSYKTKITNGGDTLVFNKGEARSGYFSVAPLSIIAILEYTQTNGDIGYKIVNGFLENVEARDHYLITVDVTLEDGVVNPIIINIDESTNDKEVLIGSSWSSMENNLPPSRGSMIYFTLGDKGYIGSGSNASGVLNDFWEYNPVSNSWSQLADLPGEPRRSAIYFSLNGKGYYGMGYNHYTGEKYADIYEFNPLDNSWKQLADFGGGPRVHSYWFVADTTFYVGSGWDLGPSLVNDLWVYHPTNDQWSQKATPSFAHRSAANGLVINGVPYLVGGGTCCGTTTPNYNEIWQYDLATDSWIEKEKTPFDLRAGTEWSINGYGYYGLGVNELNEYNNKIYRYSPATDSWALFTQIPGHERYDPFIFIFNESIYLGLGWDQNESYYTDMWKFTL